MKEIIKITHNAWKKIYDITLKSNNNNLLFSATSGGCNGFNFNLKLMKNEDYKVIKKTKSNYLTNNDVKVFIDPISEMHLIGTEIDYVYEDFNKGIFENKFVFNIDKKISSSCGCGVSFMPKNLK
jgi:iron-sulfur cluster assembly accessory protein